VTRQYYKTTKNRKPIHLAIVIEGGASTSSATLHRQVHLVLRWKAGEMWRTLN